MSNERHTPGPWIVANDFMIYAQSDINGSRRIACTLPDKYKEISLEEAKANANLIASAPELLKRNKRLVEALKVCVDVIEQNTLCNMENYKKLIGETDYKV